MKHIRWGDNDHYFGPFTFAKEKRSYRPLALVIGSGDEDYPGCRVRISAFGGTVICALPPIVRPWKKKVIVTSWGPETIARLGRDWYWDTHEREYGFSYCGSGGIGDGGFFQLFLGRQTNDSSTEQRLGYFTPWNNWRHMRHSFYDLSGVHFWSEPEKKYSPFTKEYWGNYYAAKSECPTRTFSFTDFDGEALTAKTRIEERQWELGTGWFKWLSDFHKPIIRRYLDIDFSGETGKRKGSWKGGTVGHSIEMLPGELHESAFRRYCAEHEMKFGGEVEKSQLTTK
jgi:hypothetical protein